MPYITKPGIEGVPHVTQQQYDQVYAALGWTIVGSPDPLPGIGSATLGDLVALGVAKNSDLLAHEATPDAHGDRTAAATALESHRTATDPHNDRAYSDTQLIDHVNADDPHDDRLWALATFALAGTDTGDGGTALTGYAQLDEENIIIGDQWLTD